MPRCFIKNKKKGGDNDLLESENKRQLSKIITYDYVRRIRVGGVWGERGTDTKKSRIRWWCGEKSKRLVPKGDKPLYNLSLPLRLRPSIPASRAAPLKKSVVVQRFAPTPTPSTLLSVAISHSFLATDAKDSCLLYYKERACLSWYFVHYTFVVLLAGLISAVLRSPVGLLLLLTWQIAVDVPTAKKMRRLPKVGIRSSSPPSSSYQKTGDWKAVRAH